MSKHPIPPHYLCPQPALLILTCLHLCRDVETLAQRAKRAKASAGGQPPAGTSRVPLVALSSPDSSPRQSPQCKFVILLSSTRVRGATLWC